MHNRANAENLLFTHVTNPGLRRHCLGVEIALSAYAEKLGEDSELWGMTGLLHDFDYELFPDEHPLVATKILQEEGWPSEMIQAIAAHYEAKTGVAPSSQLDKYLLACDELSGFVIAVALVRPSKDLAEVEVSSVLKKLKIPAFAAGVDREHVYGGAALIGVPLEEHVAFCLRAMQGQRTRLALPPTS